MALNIWYGTNENRHLSNLALRPFTIQLDNNGEVHFKSVEHGYQSLKSGELDLITYNKNWQAGSKHIGRKKAYTHNNWNIGLMKELIYFSFQQNASAAVMLKATGDAQLTHYQDKGIWRNEFPRILMEVREML